MCVKKHKYVKVNVVLFSEFVRGENSDIFYNGSSVEQLLLTSDFKMWYDEIVENMLEEISIFKCEIAVGRCQQNYNLIFMLQIVTRSKLVVGNH